MPRPTRADVVRTIEESGVVAVIRIREAEKLSAVVHALASGGVRTLEVTMTVPGAIECMARLAPTLPEGFLLGAGTVLDVDTALRTIHAGARFVVGPVFRPAIVEACHLHDVPALPGCFTPTEILTAWECGADIVKLFPATALGPGFIKDVRAPLPQVKLMPTGGVTLDNAGAWIEAGAVAVGLGSALVDPKAVAACEFGVLTANAARVVQNVRAARMRPLVPAQS